MWLSLVERHVRDVEAVGSSPVTSTTSVTLDPKSLWIQRYFYVCSRTRGLRMHIFAARRCMKYIKKDAKLHFYLSDRLVSI